MKLIASLLVSIVIAVPLKNHQSNDNQIEAEIQQDLTTEASADDTEAPVNENSGTVDIGDIINELLSGTDDEAITKIEEMSVADFDVFLSDMYQEVEKLSGKTITGNTIDDMSDEEFQRLLDFISA